MRNNILSHEPGINRTQSDELKGLAITLITIGHCLSDFTRALTPLGGIGVAIFLIMSGYGLNESLKRCKTEYYSGGGNFWIKRVDRVWIPYFLLITIVCAIKGSDAITYIKEVSWIGASFWYVQYILLCYITFWITSFIREDTLRIICLFAFGLISLFFMDGVRGEQFLSFSTGVLLSVCSSRSQNLTNKKMFHLMIGLLLLCGIVFLAIKQTGWYRDFEADDGIRSLIIVNVINMLVKFPVALAVIFGMIYSKMKRNAILLWIGTISYELYLVQMHFYSFIGNDMTLAVSVVVGSVLLAYVFNLFNKAVGYYILKIK